MSTVAKTGKEGAVVGRLVLEVCIGFLWLAGSRSQPFIQALQRDHLSTPDPRNFGAVGAFKDSLECAEAHAGAFGCLLPR